MSEYRFQLNVKVGQHLVNVIGNDAAEFEANLKFTEENAGGIVKAAVALEAAYGVNALPVASVQVSQSAAASQPAGPNPSCRHGDMEFKPAGVSKAGRKYSAFYACTSGNRQDQCPAVWTT